MTPILLLLYGMWLLPLPRQVRRVFLSRVVFLLPQEGSQGITVVTDPADVADLSAAGGTIDVDVSLPGSATGWDAALTTNPGTFLSFGWPVSGAAGTDDVLEITYTQNAAAALREGVVTLTATGGSGTAQSVAITITQLGTGPNVRVRAAAGFDFMALPASAGTITATVALTGGATDWTAVASTSNPADFLTVGDERSYEWDAPDCLCGEYGCGTYGYGDFYDCGRYRRSYGSDD